MLAFTEVRVRRSIGWARLAYEQRANLPAKPPVVRRKSSLLVQPYLIPPIQAVKQPEPWKRMPADPRRSVYLPPRGSIAWSLLGQVMR
jgi:hypothetical protein